MALVTQLAASGPPHPVLAYLAEAQQRGLIGLWSNLCKGRLPLRCTKQWYFATFCATEAKAFTDGNYAALGADARDTRATSTDTQPQPCPDPRTDLRPPARPRPDPLLDAS